MRLERRDQADHQSIAFGNVNLVFGRRIVDPLALGEAGLVFDGIARHHLVIGIDNEGSHFDLRNPGFQLFGRSPLQLQPDRHNHLCRAILAPFAKTADPVQPDIEDLARLVHLHEGVCALLRRGNIRAGDVVRLAGACRQQGPGNKKRGKRSKCLQHVHLRGVACHAAHLICFLEQQQLTCVP